MPNFIVEFSAPLTEQVATDVMIDKVYSGAKASGHFPPEAIKVRTQSRSNYRLHTGQNDFLHVAGHILSGRTDEQKKVISEAILTELKTLPLSSVFVSVEIVDIHRESFVDHTF
ncbi:MAG: 5-carboxymethyl-2-hydroxymuconate Delta-isomerase [Pseudomonadota bacterium]